MENSEGRETSENGRWKGGKSVFIDMDGKSKREMKESEVEKKK